LIAGLRRSPAKTGFSCQLVTGLGHLDQAIAGIEGGGYAPGRFRIGLDPLVSCLTTSAFFLWLLGCPDRAVGRAEPAVALATELNHPYSLAYAFYDPGSSICGVASRRWSWIARLPRCASAPECLSSERQSG
jgi:hypothetical protein